MKIEIDLDEDTAVFIMACMALGKSVLFRKRAPEAVTAIQTIGPKLSDAQVDPVFLALDKVRN